MGLLSGVEPLSWSATLPLTDHVRTSGVRQLVNLLNSHGRRTGDEFKWGDEIEYFIVKVGTRSAQNIPLLDYTRCM